MRPSWLRRRALSLAYHLYAVIRWQLLGAVTLGVRILLVQDGAVLLIRHTYQDGWNLPGGGIKRGESVSVAACREAAEEVGAIVLDTPWLLGVYENFHAGKSDHIALLVSESWLLTSPSDRWEIDARVVFALDHLPPDLPSRLRAKIDDYSNRRLRNGESQSALKMW